MCTQVCLIPEYSSYTPDGFANLRQTVQKLSEKSNPINFRGYSNREYIDYDELEKLLSAYQNNTTIPYQETTYASKENFITKIYNYIKLALLGIFGAFVSKKSKTGAATAATTTAATTAATTTAATATATAASGGGSTLMKAVDSVAYAPIRSAAKAGAAKGFWGAFKTLGKWGKASVITATIFEGLNLAGAVIEGPTEEDKKQGIDSRGKKFTVQLGDSAGTIGGAFAGAKFGAALGASVGTIFPGLGNVVGGAIGGVLGAIGGGIAGSKLGKAIGKGAVKLWDGTKKLWNKIFG